MDLKKLIVGTPLERPARAFLRRVRGAGSGRELSDAEVRGRRDDKNIDRVLSERLRRTSNCVDVGAHQGLFLKRFIKSSPDGRHFAFEPLPRFAEALRRDFPSVDVFCCALANRTGKASFCHVIDRPAWSGLRTQPYPTETPLETIEVELVRLDDVLPPEVPIDFIKVDVEGAELEVFRGAIETMKRFKPTLLFEHAAVHNREYGTTPEMVFDFLALECGLGVYCLDGRGPLSMTEFGRLYRSAAATNYDRDAQTNFLALDSSSSMIG